MNTLSSLCWHRQTWVPAIPANTHLFCFSWSLPGTAGDIKSYFLANKFCIFHNRRKLDRLFRLDLLWIWNVVAVVVIKVKKPEYNDSAGLTNLITQSFSDFSWLPSLDLGDNEIEGDGKRVEGWTLVVVKPRWVFDWWQYLYMVTTNVLINALQEIHSRQKTIE